MDFLPVNMDEARARGWEQLDFVIVTADAYIDHPSFGTAIISRVLESKGFKVGIIAQPNWKTTEDFMKFGKPRLSFLVNGGNIEIFEINIKKDSVMLSNAEGSWNFPATFSIYCIHERKYQY